MKTVFHAILLSTVAFLAGCSSVSVNLDVDQSADFSVYRTYCWADTMDIKTDADQKGSELELIESKTAQLLAEKNLKYGGDNPDLIVTFHTGSENKIEVSDFGYSYGGDYSGWQDAGVGIYPYKTGTLVVDLIDARTKTLVWRGSAQGVMLSGTKRQTDKLISKALDEMFEKYPPK